LVSIALCTYNGEQYLAQQLRSILDQSYENIEVIAVDDCSSDDTLSILQQFAAQDPRVRLFQNETNLGFRRNFERAMKLCSGEYIALADQDDVWLPHKIATLLDEIGDNLFIYSRVRLIDTHNMPIDRPFPTINRVDGWCALSLLFDNSVTGHACLMRRELLERALPLPDLFVHDQWLAIVAAASGQLKASRQMLSLYRLHASNAILDNKRRRTESRAAKNLTRLQHTIKMLKTLRDAAILPEQDQTQLERLLQLLPLNDRCFYNHKLARFLRKHSSQFLRLYSNRRKAILKLCRGVRYFQLLDFFSPRRPTSTHAH
jgi:glycosyltransferase involved in cell wall biosynthesis